MRLFAPSIRASLLLWLLPPLLQVVVFASLMDYRAVDRTVDGAYDRVLQNVAVAIASGVRVRGGAIVVDVPPERLVVLLSDPSDSMYYRVIGPSGETIDGEDDLFATDTGVPIVFFDDEYRGAPMRAVAVQAPTDLGTALVIVAETRRKRDESRRSATASLLVEDLVILVLTAGVCLVAVSAALKPVHRLAGQVASRSAGDLQPVSMPEQQTPREIQPLTDALNRLLGSLAESRDAQRRFVENAAHQLRTPLTGVKGQLEIALGQANRLPRGADPAQTQALEHLVERLQRAERAADGLVHLTNQLLVLSRADRGATAGAGTQEVALAELVDDTVSDLVDAALARQQDLGAETDPVSVAAVPWQLREMLANLIDNAIRCTPHGGRITVRCGEVAGAAFVEVEDTGPGIPQAERERVFERFYRAPGSPAGGSGLGLAIVREIADRHQASVRILDAPSGGGTLVRVDFPSSITSARTSAAAGT